MGSDLRVLDAPQVFVDVDGSVAGVNAEFCAAYGGSDRRVATQVAEQVARRPAGLQRVEGPGGAEWWLAVHRSARDGAAGSVLVCVDVTDGLRLVAEERDSCALALDDSMDQVEAMRAAQRDMASMERRRVAEMLHDDVVQRLIVVGWQIDDLDVAAGQAAEIRNLLDDAVARVRDMIGDLRQSTAVSQLSASLAESADMFKTTYGLDVCVDLSVQDLDEALNATVFRIVREGLRNVVKHANASSASVSVRSEGSDVVVRVADNGNGYDPRLARERAAAGHVGLSSLQETAEHSGGTLLIRARADGTGTELISRLPVG